MNNYCINCGPSEPCETTQDGDDICGCGRVLLSGKPPVIRELEQEKAALNQRIAELEKGYDCYCPACASPLFVSPTKILKRTGQ